MAIYKLGAIVTGIVGSIGGTNFKRGKNNLIVTNKSFGGSRNTLLKNDQLGNIATIFKKWSLLTESERTDWNSAALNFQFNDKFGVPKNLTGRQLFTKLNIQLLPSGGSIQDTSGINSNVESFSLDSAVVDFTNQTAVINRSGAPVEVNFCYQAEVTKKNIYQPNFTKRKTFYTGISEINFTINVWDKFIEAFPYCDPTYKIAFYVFIINEYGFKSPTQFINAEVV